MLKKDKNYAKTRIHTHILFSLIYLHTLQSHLFTIIIIWLTMIIIKHIKNHPKFQVDLMKEARQDLHYQSMVEELLGLKDDVGA